MGEEHIVAANNEVLRSVIMAPQLGYLAVAAATASVTMGFSLSQFLPQAVVDFRYFVASLIGCFHPAAEPLGLGSLPRLPAHECQVAFSFQRTEVMAGVLG